MLIQITLLFTFPLGMFKRNGDGGIITSTNDAGGEEYYYNDAMPWEGAAIEYVQEIVQVRCAIHMFAVSAD